MRVRDGDGGGEVTAPPQHLVFAYYITGHGFGHATRALEVRRPSLPSEFRLLRPFTAGLPAWCPRDPPVPFPDPACVPPLSFPPAGGEAPGRRGARRARGHRRARVRLHHRDHFPEPPHPQGPARLRRRPGRCTHRRPPRLTREGFWLCFAVCTHNSILSIPFPLFHRLPCFSEVLKKGCAECSITRRLWCPGSPSSGPRRSGSTPSRPT